LHFRLEDWPAIEDLRPLGGGSMCIGGRVEPLDLSLGIKPNGASLGCFRW
jgi:hypothetical protein